MSNSILNEMTSTVDISNANFKLSNLIHRIYTNSILNRIGAHIRIKHPIGSIFAFKSTYMNDYANVDKSSTPYATVLPEFGGNKNNNQELIVNAEMQHKVVSREINVQTKKIKSIWTREAIQDLEVLMEDKNAGSLLEEEFLTEILQEIDCGALKMMSDKATKVSKTIADKTPYNLYGAIQAEAIKIASQTKRTVTMCVTADYEICSLLMSHPNFVYNTDFSNSYYMGNIGALEVYQNPFGNTAIPSNSALISYKNRSNNTEIADGSVCYAFYNYTITEAIDSNTSNKSFFHFVRYDIVQHPLDNTDNNKSIFLTLVTFN